MTPETDRIVAGARGTADRPEVAMRPLSLDDFVGQRQVRENLRVFIAAAKGRGEALDHVLFHGPPGLGKTTLAQIVAAEMGAGFRATSGRSEFPRSEATIRSGSVLTRRSLSGRRGSGR